MTRAEDRKSRKEVQQEVKSQYEQFLRRFAEEVTDKVLNAVVIEMINNLAGMIGRNVEVVD